MKTLVGAGSLELQLEDVADEVLDFLGRGVEGGARRAAGADEEGLVGLPGSRLLLRLEVRNTLGLEVGVGVDPPVDLLEDTAARVVDAVDGDDPDDVVLGEVVGDCQGGGVDGSESGREGARARIHSRFRPAPQGVFLLTQGRQTLPLGPGTRHAVVSSTQAAHACIHAQSPSLVL